MDRGTRATDHEHRPSTTTTLNRSALEHHGRRITARGSRIEDRGSRPPDHIQSSTNHEAGRDPLAPSLTGGQPRRTRSRPTLEITIEQYLGKLEITYRLAKSRLAWSTLNSTTSTRSPKRKGATWAPSLAR
jgi:hypothetical protein